MAISDTLFQSNSIGFHALVDGPMDGPLVLLLHGFPELAQSWRLQIPVLAKAGFRVVAPDLRGYGGTDKAGPYDLATLAADVAGLVHANGRERATIIGHDWGAGIAWATGFLQPQVVERLGIMNCPHPCVLADTVRSSARQLRNSWYILFFQLPWLPELATTRNGAAAIGRSLRGGSKVRGAFTAESVKPYERSYLQPGAATAAIGYYRAAFANVVKDKRLAKANPIKAPIRIIWGAEDQFLGQEMISTDAMRGYLAPGNVPVLDLIPGAGHFVQNEAPDQVNDALLRWLKPAASDAA